MPCDRVYRTPVVLTKVTEGSLKVEHLDLLVDGLEAAGYTITSRSDTRIVATHPAHGTLTYEGGTVRQETKKGQTALATNDLNVNYSKAVVQKVATKFGWSLKPQRAESEQIAFAFTASKRKF